jgi:CRISPR/Cas system-associated exonuclease Cas4 (RecB family)
MPQQGFHCIVDFEDVSFEACVTCAATQGRCQLTASLLRGMADQARARNESDAERERAREDGLESAMPPLSVTALTGCTRQAYLKTTEPYYQRPDQQYWAYRGTLGHLLAERGAGPEIVAEQRFERVLSLPSGRAVTITGQPDEIDPARGLLIDYKTTDRAPRQPSPMHIAQLNAYRWLVTPHHGIERLGIVYLTMKGVQKAAVPIWPDGQVERFLIERAGALAEAYAGGAWPAMTEDRWLCQFCPVSGACERGPLESADATDERDEARALSLAAS